MQEHRSFIRQSTTLKKQFRSLRILKQTIKPRESGNGDKGYDMCR